MGRIEEIKEEAIKAIKCEEESSLDYYYDMDMGNHIKTQVENVRYLLSKLEIAINEFNKIEQLTSTSPSINEMIIHQKAREALQQLRE